MRYGRTIRVATGKDMAMQRLWYDGSRAQGLSKKISTIGRLINNMCRLQWRRSCDYRSSCRMRRPTPPPWFDFILIEKIVPWLACRGSDGIWEAAETQTNIAKLLIFCLECENNSILISNGFPYRTTCGICETAETQMNISKLSIFCLKWKTIRMMIWQKAKRLGENVDDAGSISEKVVANFAKSNKMEDSIGRSRFAVSGWIGVSSGVLDCEFTVVLLLSYIGNE